MLNPQRNARARLALQGLFVGDSLAMPVHWYYRPTDIRRDFAPKGILGLEAAPATHPGAIMSLHSTSQGGRRSVERGGAPQVVGDVILKGRREHWGRSGTHYHHGMPAGENTLNAWCARWLLEDLGQHGGAFDLDRWLTLYETKMTAEPAAHPDTYAESYHRGFFANRVAGKALRDCAAVTHDTPSIGAMIGVAALAVVGFANGRELEVVQEDCRILARSTHPDRLVGAVSDALVLLLHRLLAREEHRPDALTDWLCEAANAVPGMSLQKLLDRNLEDPVMVGQVLSPACYLDGSWPAVCAFASRYRDDPRTGLLANTNVGGDNVHRGSVLGALLGALSDGAMPWWDGLVNQAALTRTIEACVNE